MAGKDKNRPAPSPTPFQQSKLISKLDRLIQKLEQINASTITNRGDARITIADTDFVCICAPLKTSINFFDAFSQSIIFFFISAGLSVFWTLIVFNAMRVGNAFNSLNKSKSSLKAYFS